MIGIEERVEKLSKEIEELRKRLEKIDVGENSPIAKKLQSLKEEMELESQ